MVIIKVEVKIGLIFLCVILIMCVLRRGGEEMLVGFVRGLIRLKIVF